MTAFVPGFALSLTLILAIGAQNAFVLKQGIKRMHVGLIVLTCVVSEFALIFAGVGGFGALVEAAPSLGTIARWGGAAFLVLYGVLSLHRAFSPGAGLQAAGGTEQSWQSAILTCLAITWLNPHVYLDTVILIGAVASQYGPDRWWFGAGAVTASAVFFLLLGYGGALLQPVFASPRAWQVLDVGIALLMWVLAFMLIAP